MLALKYLKWMQPYSYTTWQDDVDVYISTILWIVRNCIIRVSYFILEDFSVVIMNKNVLSGMLLPNSKEIMLCPSFSLCRLLNGIELPCLVHLFTARCRLNNRRFIALKRCQLCWSLKGDQVEQKFSSSFSSMKP